jgi:uroporphyrinogen decarboxylase
MSLNESNSLFLRAARGEKTERPPVWAMRQAGRWDPEFHRIRSGLSFYEFSENVEKSAEASLCPRRFGVDAIILFYDITTLPVAMGQRFQLIPGKGPVPDRPIRAQADLDAMDANPDPDRYGFILDLLARVRGELNGELPVLAFAGAPFTVASYSIGTGKDLDATRKFAAENPTVWQGLLDKLQTATIGFLNSMIKQGAAAYQLFDSWAGELTLDEYDRWAQPYHRTILNESKGTPRILFVKECPYLDRLTSVGAEIISLGSQHNLAQARSDYPHLIFQGNVASELLQTGTEEEVVDATNACLTAGGGFHHIVNLNHGVDKSTPVKNFEAFVNTVRGYRRS